MLSLTPRNDFKPTAQWNWTPRLVDPRYASMMSGLAFLTPLWEGMGDVFDVVTNIQLTLDTLALWGQGQSGIGLTRLLSSSQNLAASPAGSSPLNTSDGAGGGDYTILSFANVAARATRQDVLDVGENGGSFVSTFLIANANNSVSASSGSMCFGTFNGSVQGIAAAGAIDGQPHCFAGRRAGTSMTLWKDGAIVAGPSVVTAQTITNSNKSIFFGNSNGSLWAGDNLYFAVGWNRALTDGELELVTQNPWGLVSQIRTYSANAVFSQSVTMGEQAVRVYQRDQSGAFNLTTDGTLVPFAGTAGNASQLSGGLTLNLNKVSGGLKLSVALGNFSTPTGTTWTGDAYVPVGDWLLGNVTDPISGAVSGNQSNMWSVGCRWLIAGQSNAVNYYGVGPSGQNVDNNVAVFNGGSTTWFAGNTSFFSLGNAFGLGQFFNSLRAGWVAGNASNTVVIAAATVASGNTTTSDWQTGNATWTAAAAIINNAAFGPKFEGVYWNLGDTNAAVYQPNPATANYFDTQTKAIISQFQTLAGRGNSTMKFGIEIIGTHFNPTAAGNLSNPFMDTIRGVLYNIATTHPGCFLLASTEDMIHGAGDPSHWPGAQYQRLGYRDGNSTLKAAYALNTGVGIGPTIASASYVGNVVAVNVTQNGGSSLKLGNGSTTGAGAQGFAVYANSVLQTINATAFVGNTINLTCNGASLAAPVQVQYASGVMPWATWTDGGSDTDDGIVYDNQTSGNASLGATGLPLISTFGNITASAGTSGGLFFAPSLLNGLGPAGGHFFKNLLG